MNSRHSPLFAIGLLLLAGCGDKTGERKLAGLPLFDVRDSAGIAIMTNRAAALDAVPALVAADSPSARIGAVDGAEHDQLFQVRGVRSLPDGSILVLNAGTQEVRRYGSDGRWLASSGRAGDGPGEFRFPVGTVVKDADSTWVLDFGTRRLTLLGPDGGIHRMVPLPSSISGLSGFLDDSTAVLSYPHLPRMARNTEVWVHAERLVMVADITTGSLDTLLHEPAPSFREYRYLMGELVRSVRAPFSVFPAPRPFGGRVVVSDGASADLRVLDRTGALRGVIRVDVPPQPVTEQMFATYVDNYLDGLDDERGESRLTPGEAARRRRILEDMERPATLPVFSALLTDGEHLWLRLVAAPDAATQHWLGLDAEGRLAFTAVLPAGFRVMELTPQHALGLEVDEVGVEYVVRYDLRAR